MSKYLYITVYNWNTYKYRACSLYENDKNIYIKIKRVGNEIEDKERVKLQQHIKDSYQNLLRVYTEFKQFPGYSSIKPIAHFPEWFSIVTEESRGADVWTILREKAKCYPSKTNIKKLEALCRKCGTWLTLFQQLSIKETKNIPYDFGAKIEMYDFHLKRLVHSQNNTFPDELRKRIVDFCWQLVPSIPKRDCGIVGVHGDYAPVNILMHNDEITILDIETPKTGIVHWDSTYFAYHLSSLLENPIYRPMTIAKLKKAFFQGVGQSIKPSEKIVTFCMIHHVIQALLYIDVHRKNVHWHKKMYDKILYNRHIHWLKKTCHI